MVMDKSAIVEALSEVLDHRDALDAETHRSQHEFVSNLIIRDKRRREIADKIRAQVGGWTVILILSGIGTAVWKAVSKP